VSNPAAPPAAPFAAGASRAAEPPHRHAALTRALLARPSHESSAAATLCRNP
jgi:hypothetical protein